MKERRKVRTWRMRRKYDSRHSHQRWVRSERPLVPQFSGSYTAYGGAFFTNLACRFLPSPDLKATSTKLYECGLGREMKRGRSYIIVPEYSCSILFIYTSDNKLLLLCLSYCISQVYLDYCRSQGCDWRSHNAGANVRLRLSISSSLT